MSINKLIQNYTAFNVWANKELTKWLLDADISLLYQNTISSFTSIDYTLQHILRTQKFWFTFIKQEDLSNLNWSIREAEVEQIIEELNTNSNQLHLLANNYSASELSEILHLDMPWAKNSRCRYEYFIHVVNHSSFHRGQIITMARTVGLVNNVPNTDYNIFNCI